eukprot:TRINITY_DN31791_c0_g1_i1.p2 TRINITY_DN31791_c0_g1~~TRINITY_DN31791_c0_g1_i1.p2  ORF type:complete len:324 (+),score=79.67 TRINITY_DN31791_c0_g1_i1:75-974(+)
MTPAASGEAPPPAQAGAPVRPFAARTQTAAPPPCSARTPSGRTVVPAGGASAWRRSPLAGRCRSPDALAAQFADPRLEGPAAALAVSRLAADGRGFVRIAHGGPPAARAWLAAQAGGADEQAERAVCAVLRAFVGHRAARASLWLPQGLLRWACEHPEMRWDAERGEVVASLEVGPSLPWLPRDRVLDLHRRRGSAPSGGACPGEHCGGELAAFRAPADSPPHCQRCARDMAPLEEMSGCRTCGITLCSDCTGAPVVARYLGQGGELGGPEDGGSGLCESTLLHRFGLGDTDELTRRWG